MALALIMTAPSAVGSSSDVLDVLVNFGFVPYKSKFYYEGSTVMPSSWRTQVGF